MSDFDAWDEDKNRLNQKRHGVSFERAQLAFSDPHLVIIRDLAHERGEKRFFCLGLVDGIVLIVRFSFRRKRIRIYSAGYWRQGKKRYEQENKIH
ncbi:MAG: hypothetical protein RLZZ117_739 [Cyanobacteriota bacterium]